MMLQFQHDIEKVVDKFDLIPEEDQLYRRSLRGDFGLAIELLNGGSYAFGSFIREDNVRSFDILKEEFYFTYTNAYAQRGWPLMEYFNSFILEANQFGFVIHWERRTVRKYLSHRVQEALEEIAAGHNEDGEFGPLSVQHIVGPMIVLGIGLVASLGIFVCEFFVSLVYRFHDKHDEDNVKRNVSRVHRARRRY
ncbi:uncharacterized protein LOC134227909 [Armigeres subalbatus]|uniref:uncharacterized protein LOC134227909 n=1 Tax=Armigeres subalbatus TaxID=124917 RepID=UPI002ED66552